MSRTLNVVRMQFVNRATYLWIPLIILGGMFAISLLIWALIPGGPKYSGGAQAPMWYFFVVGIQSLTLTFPFSQAMSVTRRQFAIGTMLTAVLTSAMLSALFVVGGFIEQATGGWWMDGYLFTLGWIWTPGPLMAAAFYFVLAMAFFSIGFASATIYKRFGGVVVAVVLSVVGLILVAAFFLSARILGWGEMFAALGNAGIGGVTLGLAALVVVLGAMSFALLRRATP